MNKAIASKERIIMAGLMVDVSRKAAQPQLLFPTAVLDLNYIT
ncbi:MAG: hypothetical protein ACLFUE_00645 [Desulfobacteraceae bacterium]